MPPASHTGSLNCAWGVYRLTNFIHIIHINITLFLLDKVLDGKVLGGKDDGFDDDDFDDDDFDDDDFDDGDFDDDDFDEYQ